MPSNSKKIFHHLTQQLINNKKSSKKTSPHLLCVATLPREISGTFLSHNYPFFEPLCSEGPHFYINIAKMTTMLTRRKKTEKTRRVTAK